MKVIIISLLFLPPLLFTACVGDDLIDDYVQPELRLAAAVDTLEVGTGYRFVATYFNNVGAEDRAEVEWASSAPATIAIATDGMATALREGSAVITARTLADGEESVATHVVYGGAATVSEPTGRGGKIAPTSNYELTGDFTLAPNGNGGVRISFGEDYRADTGLPGLYVYLTNNASTTANALEIGAVTVFAGAHSYDIPNVGVNDHSHLLYFCKPFNVKVGDGRIE